MQQAVQPPLVSAVVFEGLSVTDGEGKPAIFAVMDLQGRVLASGPAVAEAAWEASVEAYRNHLIGQGHLRVLRNPAGHEPA